MCHLNIRAFDKSGRPVDQFTLNSGDDNAIRTFTAYHKIKTGGSEVLRGTLSQEGFASKEAVAKLAQADLSKIQYEADLYSRHLAPLQGLYVPYFYGYYKGKVPLSEGRPEVDVGCLVLEYCGRPLARHLLDDMRIQERVAKAWLSVHEDAGLQHNDLAECEWKNVLVRDTRGFGNVDDMEIRIVDFSDACEHTCGRAMTIDSGCYQPPRTRFNCHELYNVVSQLGIWTPSVISFLGHKYNIFEVHDVRRLVDAARRRELRYELYSEETLEGEAREVLGLYYSRWGNRFQGGVMHPPVWCPDRVPDATPDEPEAEGLIIPSRYWTASPEPGCEIGLETPE